MEYNKVCLMYRAKDSCVDGIRSALGLAVENMYAYGCVMDGVKMDKFNELQTESLEMLRDMEGDVFAITKENKAEQEAAELELLRKNSIDFVVLARYMQILSSDFVKNYPDKVINIHHSFLPAFAGAKPYHAAHERGVKIIGATSHYVTADLDAGPIIEQDVTRCSHVDTVQSLIRKGRDLEKIVLSQAVYKHLQRKILVYKNRTVVFN